MISAPSCSGQLCTLAFSFCKTINFLHCEVSERSEQVLKPKLRQLPRRRPPNRRPRTTVVQADSVMAGSRLTAGGAKRTPLILWTTPLAATKSVATTWAVAPLEVTKTPVSCVFVSTSEKARARN
jgi:hypothetical protein